MKNKKGIEMSLQTIVILIIVIIVLIVMIVFFSDHYTANSESVNEVANNVLNTS